MSDQSLAVQLLKGLTRLLMLSVRYTAPDRKCVCTACRLPFHRIGSRHDVVSDMQNICISLHFSCLPARSRQCLPHACSWP